MFHSDAYFSFIRNAVCIHRTARVQSELFSVFQPLFFFLTFARLSLVLQESLHIKLRNIHKFPDLMSTWLDMTFGQILFDWLPDNTTFPSVFICQQTPPLTPPASLWGHAHMPRETFHLRWPCAWGKAAPPSLLSSLLPPPLSFGCKLLHIL